MAFNIVLIEPEIPNNTGNIGRLALASGCNLHLVKPFGFELNDKRLKRAGLDYWQHLTVHIYESTEAFFDQHQGKKMVFLSAKATKAHYEIDFEDNLFLVFGKESVGLAPEITAKHHDALFKIPMFSKQIRSLNLANTVAITVYEGLKKYGF